MATSSPLQSSGSASTLTYCWLIAIAVSSARAVMRNNENFLANACRSHGGAADNICITCLRSDDLDPLERVRTHRSVFASSRADANRRTVTCGEGNGSCPELMGRMVKHVQSVDLEPCEAAGTEVSL